MAETGFKRSWLGLVPAALGIWVPFMMQVGPDDAVLNLCKWPRKIAPSLPADCLPGVSANQIYFVAIALVAISIVWLTRPYLTTGTRRKKMTVGLTLFFFGVAVAIWGLSIIASGDALPKRVDNTPSTPDEPAPKLVSWNWVWEPLSTDEIVRIAKDIPNQIKSEIVISSARINSAALTETLAKALRDGGLKVNVMASIHPETEGLTGVSFSAATDISRPLQGAIERNSKLKVGFRESRFANAGPALFLLIGGKPLPDTLPPEIQKATTDLGKRMEDISKEIISFAFDRQSSENLLPPRNAYSPDVSGAQAQWNRGVQFSHETESLFSTRYANRMNSILLQLSLMGINLPFTVQNNYSRPNIIGKWLGAVGELLTKNDIMAARQVSADNQFWFGQR
jgi:hypothetical protein